MIHSSAVFRVSVWLAQLGQYCTPSIKELLCGFPVVFPSGPVMLNATVVWVDRAGISARKGGMGNHVVGNAIGCGPRLGSTHTVSNAFGVGAANCRRLPTFTLPTTVWRFV